MMRWFKVVTSRINDGRLTRLMGSDDWWFCRALLAVCEEHCAQNLTDGFIATERIALLTPNKKRALRAAKRLVEIGLLSEVPGGFRAEDWAKINQSREEYEAEKNRKVRNQADSRRNKKNVTGDKSGDSPAVEVEVEDRERETVADAKAKTVTADVLCDMAAKAGIGKFFAGTIPHSSAMEVCPCTLEEVEVAITKSQGHAQSVAYVAAVIAGERKQKTQPRQPPKAKQQTNALRAVRNVLEDYCCNTDRAAELISYQVEIIRSAIREIGSGATTDQILEKIRNVA